MDKIKCLIVDDEPIAQRILEGYLSDLPEFELTEKCPHALAARQVLSENKIDLMFLDLEMPKLKGFSFLKTLRNPPAVIITTAHREHALEGYELEVLDYLLKPISFERFLKSIDRYKKIFSPEIKILNTPRDPVFLYVKSNRKTLKLRQDDILYIEGMSNYVKIHCEGLVHTVYSSLQNILNKLGPPFFRVHKSFIVNKNKITAFTGGHIEIGDKQVPIGSTYREVVTKF